VKISPRGPFNILRANRNRVDTRRSSTYSVANAQNDHLLGRLRTVKLPQEEKGQIEHSIRQQFSSYRHNTLPGCDRTYCSVSFGAGKEKAICSQVGLLFRAGTSLVSPDKNERRNCSYAH